MTFVWLGAAVFLAFMAVPYGTTVCYKICDRWGNWQSIVAYVAYLVVLLFCAIMFGINYA